MAGERRIDRLERAAHQEVLRLGADRDDLLGRARASTRRAVCVEQRLIARQQRQLLGQGVAADRPQSGAGAAGEDHGNEHGHGDPLAFRELTGRAGS